MIQWDQPQRQSLAALLILSIKFLKAIFKGLWPVLLASVFKGKEQVGLQITIILVGFIVLAFIASVADYYFFRFYILQNQLMIHKGIFKKENITIPFSKIQSVHSEQSILHTITGTFKIIVDTAGTQKAEVQFAALSKNVAEALREQLLLSKPTAENEAAVKPPEKSIIKVTPFDLLKLSITANHAETIAIVCAFVFSKLEDFKPWISKNNMEWLEKYEQELQATWSFFLIVSVAVIIISMLVSAVRVVLRYANFKVVASVKGFHINGGLIQVKQMMVPYNKVQLMQWNANFFKRIAGMYLLHLKAIGDTDLKKKQKILLPITQQHQIQSITPYYLQNLPSANTEAYGIHKAFFWRSLWLIGVPIAVFAAVAGYCIWGLYGLLLLLWLIYFALIKHIYFKNFCFWVNEEGIEIHKGAWGTQQILLQWNKVQFVSLWQSPYQHSHELATLTMQTAGGRIKIPYLPLAQASFLADFILMKIESSAQKWM